VLASAAGRATLPDDEIIAVETTDVEVPAEPAQVEPAAPQIEAKAEPKMSADELKAQLELKAKTPHKPIEEHESPAIVEARTHAAIKGGKVHLETHGRPKGEGLTEAAKTAFLEDRKEKAAAKTEAPKA